MVGGELAHLPRRRVGQPGAAVPDVAEPERAGRVDVLAPGVVSHDGALAAHDRHGVLADGAHVCERVPEDRVHGMMLRR